MLVPKGTSRNIVERIHGTVAEVVRKQDVADRFASQGLQTHVSSPAEFNRYLLGELARWDQVVRAAEISVD
jgi:tripartite-type tricarboxylate transporter receptor subunit TctC